MRPNCRCFVCKSAAKQGCILRLDEFLDVVDTALKAAACLQGRVPSKLFTPQHIALALLTESLTRDKSAADSRPQWSRMHQLVGCRAQRARQSTLADRQPPHPGRLNALADRWLPYPGSQRDDKLRILPLRRLGTVYSPGVTAPMCPVTSAPHSRSAPPCHDCSCCVVCSAALGASRGRKWRTEPGN